MIQQQLFAQIPAGPLFVANQHDPQYAAPVPAQASMAGRQDTVIIRGFPTDATRREIENAFKWLPGAKEVRAIEKPGKPPICFVSFWQPQHVGSALHDLNNFCFDEKSCPLRCDVARTNMRTQDADGARPARNPPTGVDNPHQQRDNAARAAAMQASADMACRTLHVGNMARGADETGLRGAFARLPGYREMRQVNPKPDDDSKGSSAWFVDFEDVAAAMAALQHGQGQRIPGSKQGGIQVKYARRPMNRKRRKPQDDDRNHRNVRRNQSARSGLQS